jgi:hypothetical protein
MLELGDYDVETFALPLHQARSHMEQLSMYGAPDHTLF